MIRRLAWIAPLAALLAAPAEAQYPRVEIQGWGGYTYSDGVSGDPFEAGDGNTYTRVDPRDSVSWGASFGVFVSENVELGFLWSRQDTHLEASGPAGTIEVSPLQVDNYHGFFAYNFREGDDAVRPYFLGGIGATVYGDVLLPTTGIDPRAVSSKSRLSSTWGAGLKLYPARNFGFVLGVRWTPTFIKSDPGGWWCDPFWGCWVTTAAQYSNQWELGGGLSLRF